MDDSISDSDTEIDILRGILNEVQDLNAQLARIDERSEQNSDEVASLRHDRVAPLENDVTTIANRSRRNSLILGAALTLVTIIVGALATYSFTLL